MSIYDAEVYSALENNINQVKYLCKSSISAKCFGDLPISVSHPRFLLQVYSLWFSKHCQKKEGKTLDSRVFLWTLASVSHFCLYSLIFFSSSENKFSSPLQCKAGADLGSKLSRHRYLSVSKADLRGC